MGRRTSFGFGVLCRREHTTTIMLTTIVIITIAIAAITTVTIDSTIMTTIIIDGSADLLRLRRLGAPGALLRGGGTLLIACMNYGYYHT